MVLTNIMKIGDSITENSTFGERALTGLQVTLIGMGVVFGVLILLMAILYIFKFFALRSGKSSKVKPAEAEPAAKTVTQPAQASVQDASGEEAVVAAATAAIAAHRGESDCAFNVISIKKIVK